MPLPAAILFAVDWFFYVECELEQICKRDGSLALPCQALAQQHTSCSCCGVSFQSHRRDDPFSSIFLFFGRAGPETPEEMAVVLLPERCRRREAAGVPRRTAGHAGFRRLLCQGMLVSLCAELCTLRTRLLSSVNASLRRSACRSSFGKWEPGLTELCPKN